MSVFFHVDINSVFIICLTFPVTLDVKGSNQNIEQPKSVNNNNTGNKNDNNNTLW